MSKKRRPHSPEFKAKVALDALKGIEPIHALAAKYQVHPTQVTQWKQELLAQLPAVFARKGTPDPTEAEAKEARLYQKIGQLEVELDWLKKNLRSSTVSVRPGTSLTSRNGNQYDAVYDDGSFVMVTNTKITGP